MKVIKRQFNRMEKMSLSFYMFRSKILVFLILLCILQLIFYHSNSSRFSTSPLPLCPSPVIPSSSPLHSSQHNLSLPEEDNRWAGILPPGGTFSPSSCLPPTNMAILIPFRDRDSHLAAFLSTMHPFLQQQNIRYTIVAVHQIGSAPFMRGLLFNAGVSLLPSVLPISPDCFVLHDVDHIPERESLQYRCSPHGVFHMAHAVDRFQYELFMEEYTGGVVALSREQFAAINGFSNMYMGWGCEDEDLYVRIVKKGLSLVRVPPEISRYRTQSHVPNYPNWFWDQQISAEDRKRFPNLKDIVDQDGSADQEYQYNKYLQDGAGDRQDMEGINNVDEFFSLEGVVRHNGYTEIRVRPDHEKIRHHGLTKYIKVEEEKDDKEL